MLEGKLGLVFGVANRRSIAWGIGQALAGAGARLAFTYEAERVKDTVNDLAGTLAESLTLPCDVLNDAQVDAAFERVDGEFGGLDILVHSIAFAPREALENPFLETTRDAFRTAMDISAYSLVQLARKAAPLMEKRGGGSIITMTYLGSDRVFPKYNVMGVAKAALESSMRYLASDLGPLNIRVNAISAGPIRTLAARSIQGFPRMEEHVREVAPLRRNTEAAEVGDVAVFLASNLARNVTGVVLFCDSGYHAMGM
ncbi:MAG TPA: enoyl-ACP reductase [Chloroflexota bacterium]|nr:enoyl-ACP reductase [Chloroflexota bacterium]